MLTITEIKRVVARIGKKYGIKSAYLFGSYARGEANTKSDIDLLIDNGNLKTYEDFFYFCKELETDLGAPVDVIPVGNSRPRFLSAIRKDQILLYGV